MFPGRGTCLRRALSPYGSARDRNSDAKKTLDINTRCRPRRCGPVFGFNFKTRRLNFHNTTTFFTTRWIKIANRSRRVLIHPARRRLIKRRVIKTVVCQTDTRGAGRFSFQKNQRVRPEARRKRGTTRLSRRMNSSKRGTACRAYTTLRPYDSLD